MADRTEIEWADATWNIITGCSPKSPGCKHCYAMRLAGTRLKHHPSRAGLTKMTKTGPVWTGEVRFNDQWLSQPLKWKKPRNIFLTAHGDLFYENVPDEWLDKIFAVMALCPQHTFQVLTKWPERAVEYLGNKKGTRDIAWTAFDLAWNEPKANIENLHVPQDSEEFPYFANFPIPNVLIGTSVEDQKRADERIEPMRQIAELGWNAFVSYEPALGPVDWRGWEFIDWMICGGESGPKARPMLLEWCRSSHDQCKEAGVPFFMKQLSGKGGKPIKNMSQFPVDMQIREYPNAT